MNLLLFYIVCFTYTFLYVYNLKCLLIECRICICHEIVYVADMTINVMHLNKY